MDTDSLKLLSSLRHPNKLGVGLTSWKDEVVGRVVGRVGGA